MLTRCGLGYEWGSGWDYCLDSSCPGLPHMPSRLYRIDNIDIHLNYHFAKCAWMTCSLTSWTAWIRSRGWPAGRSAGICAEITPSANTSSTRCRQGIGHFILPDLIYSGQLELEEETVCVNGDEIP